VLESVSPASSLMAAILAPTKLSPGVVAALPAILNLIPTPSPPSWLSELPSSLDVITTG